MKNIHNLTIMILEIFWNSKYDFKMFKLQEPFVKCKWVIMCVAFEQNCDLWYKKLNLKVVIIF